jgi:hypothetical protein
MFCYKILLLLDCWANGPIYSDADMLLADCPLSEYRPDEGGAGTDDSEQKTPLVWVTDQPHQVRLFAGAPMGVAGGELTEVTSECH